MEDYTLGVVEGKFADLLWERVPMSTSDMVKLAEQELEWKRTTTYTVLKKFSNRGMFENQNGTVVALISKEDFYARQSECYVEQSFGGSLPSFLTAFTSRRKLGEQEIADLRAIIEQYDKGQS